MKVAIIGGRNFSDKKIFQNSITQLIGVNAVQIDEVVSGGASGADAMAEEYSKDNNIPIKVFKADWKKYGRAAGPVRNKLIVEYADAVVAFWDGKSKGTKSSINLAKKQGKKLFICDVLTGIIKEEV